MDNISIIIRNKNEADYIGFALQSCIEFFDKPEIIVVNNNSTDDSLDVVQNFNNRTNIIIKNINNYKPGKAINTGVKLATNDYILVLSAHTQIIKLDFDLVKKHLNKHKAVFGKQIPVHRGKKVTPGYIWTNFSNSQSVNLYSDIEKRNFLHNAFCFYTKKTLTDYPMPENYFGKEDRYWAKEIVEKDLTYLYDPNLVCYHFWTKNGATWKGLV
ncbi:MAG: glycosyltransferase family A protein [Bacteroidota bacterium]|nr:glycosyltransferase family A protein [Bacteroidota bacterium]|tara:strand:+ start:28 stop:669 length:642 start_codon:yes stop_codon:yes gene_type:complete